MKLIYRTKVAVRRSRKEIGLRRFIRQYFLSCFTSRTFVPVSFFTQPVYGLADLWLFAWPTSLFDYFLGGPCDKLTDTLRLPGGRYVQKKLIKSDHGFTVSRVFLVRDFGDYATVSIYA